MKTSEHRLFRQVRAGVMMALILALALSVPVLARAEALGKDVPPPQLELPECLESEEPVLQKPKVTPFPPENRQGCHEASMNSGPRSVKGGLKIKLHDGQSDTH